MPARVGEKRKDGMERGVLDESMTILQIEFRQAM